MGAVFSVILFFLATKRKQLKKKKYSKTNIETDNNQETKRTKLDSKKNVFAGEPSESHELPTDPVAPFNPDTNDKLTPSSPPLNFKDNKVSSSKKASNQRLCSTNTELPGPSTDIDSKPIPSILKPISLVQDLESKDIVNESSYASNEVKNSAQQNSVENESLTGLLITKNEEKESKKSNNSFEEDKQTIESNSFPHTSKDRLFPNPSTTYVTSDPHTSMLSGKAKIFSDSQQSMIHSTPNSQELAKPKVASENDASSVTIEDVEEMHIKYSQESVYEDAESLESFGSLTDYPTSM